MGSKKPAAWTIPSLYDPSTQDALSHKAETQSRQVSPAPCLQDLDQRESRIAGSEGEQPKKEVDFTIQWLWHGLGVFLLL